MGKERYATVEDVRQAQLELLEQQKRNAAQKAEWEKLEREKLERVKQQVLHEWLKSSSLRPDYRPVIKALRQLVTAFETLQNGGVDEHEKRSERAKKVWAGRTIEERRVRTSAARKARRKGDSNGES